MANSNELLHLEDNMFCILLTGTIAPTNIPNLKRLDHKEREQDYYKAIEKWMSLNYPVVFIENSGYESKSINSLFESRPDCEFVQFVSSVSYLGKGHGEAEIINYGFEMSEILCKSVYIIKSSGRQYISNTTTIIESIKSSKLFVLCWLKRYLQYADSRFFVAKKDFFTSYLSKEMALIDEKNDIYFEHVLARAVHRSIADGELWLPPIDYPICYGISGTENLKYRTDLKSILKGRVIFKIMHRIFRNDFL
ncbi:hypothetical protein [Fibrivirga algicola]|uniref:Uncharacterized protein n=1 Tax=Fibrivirga algicola TaxID=2950420 RepID=A0ABX0QM29_9BACT|nr:hypothetical protein [Fibrivirga algicola]NID11658.1 hypothetical protein [Fibrivirga algicola]